MSGTTEAVSVDELWTRVSVHLAYRKKKRRYGCKKPASAQTDTDYIQNKLAEQLSMTGALVDKTSPKHYGLPVWYSRIFSQRTCQFRQD